MENKKHYFKKKNIFYEYYVRIILLSNTPLNSSSSSLSGNLVFETKCQHDQKSIKICFYQKNHFIDHFQNDDDSYIIKFSLFFSQSGSVLILQMMDINNRKYVDDDSEKLLFSVSK